MNYTTRRKINDALNAYWTAIKINRMDIARQRYAYYRFLCIMYFGIAI